MPAATAAALPWRILVASSATQVSASGSPLSKNDQAAFHMYSRTWTKSQRMVTMTPRRAASAGIPPGWGLLASGRARPGRTWGGARTPAPPVTAAPAGPGGGGGGARAGGGPPGGPGHLPFAQLDSGGTGDRGGAVAEGPAGGLDDGKLAQPVGVLFLRQVQRRIQRVHVRGARRPVGHPRHRDLPEHRRERPVMIPFRPRARDAVRTPHRITALLAGGKQVQVTLVQPAQQLPTPRRELVLQFRMRHLRRLRAGQPRLGLLIAPPGLRERPCRLPRVLLHLSPASPFP